MSRKSRHQVLLWSFTAIALVITVFPFYWMLNTSLKPATDVFVSPPTFGPSHWTLDAYTSVFAHKPMARYFMNSVVVSLGSTALSVLLAALAAYGFTRFFVRGA